MTRFIDFDAALAEAAAEPVIVRYQGRDWTLYASIPAKPVMRLLHLQAEGRDTDELAQREVVTFLSEMVPADVLEAWLDGGMSIDEMAKLLRAVVAAYRVGDAEENQEGEAPGPTVGPPPSLRTGAPSRPTSPASTPSTCPEL